MFKHFGWPSQRLTGADCRVFNSFCKLYIIAQRALARVRTALLISPSGSPKTSKDFAHIPCNGST